MKKITALLTLALSMAVFAGNKGIDVIYGEDNRVDVIESTDSMYV